MPQTFTLFKQGLKTWKLPGWLGLGASPGVYRTVKAWPQFTNMAVSDPQAGLLFSREAFLPPVVVTDVVCPEPETWYWFVDHPASSRAPRVNLDWVRKGYGVKPFPQVMPNPWWFPENSVFYGPDPEFMRSIGIGGIHAWPMGWQGIRWLNGDDGGLVIQYGGQVLGEQRLRTQTLRLSPADLETLNFFSDDAKLKQMSRAEVVTLYYSLREFIRISHEPMQYCTGLKPCEFTPRGFVNFEAYFTTRSEKAAGAVTLLGMCAVWERELRQRLWDVRPDLRTLTTTDANGKSITLPVLAPPNEFPSDDLSMYVHECPDPFKTINLVVSIAVSVFTLGAPALMTLPLTLTQALVSFGEQLNMVDRLKRIQQWEATYLPGAQLSQQDVSVVTTPDPVTQGNVVRSGTGITGKNVLYIAGAVGLAVWLLS